MKPKRQCPICGKRRKYMHVTCGKPECVLANAGNYHVKDDLKILFKGDVIEL